MEKKLKKSILSILKAKSILQLFLLLQLNYLFLQSTLPHPLRCYIDGFSGLQDFGPFISTSWVGEHHKESVKCNY